MNQWDRFEIMLNTVVDDTFAEKFLFQPMSEGTIVGEEYDPEREKQEIKAIFTWEADLADIKDMHGVGKKRQIRHTSFHRHGNPFCRAGSVYRAAPAGGSFQAAGKAR